MTFLNYSWNPSSKVQCLNRTGKWMKLFEFDTLWHGMAIWWPCKGSSTQVGCYWQLRPQQAGWNTTKIHLSVDVGFPCCWDYRRCEWLHSAPELWQRHPRQKCRCCWLIVRLCVTGSRASGSQLFRRRRIQWLVTVTLTGIYTNTGIWLKRRFTAYQRYTSALIVLHLWKCSVSLRIYLVTDVKRQYSNNAVFNDQITGYWLFCLQPLSTIQPQLLFWSSYLKSISLGMYCQDQWSNNVCNLISDGGSLFHPGLRKCYFCSKWYYRYHQSTGQRY